GIHGSAVSTYERGRKIPELRTVERLVSAMGFPLSALDQTRAFIEAIRIHSALTETIRSAADELESAGEDDPVFSRDQLAANPAALRWELEQVSVDAGRVFSRMAKVMFALMDRAGRVGPAG